MVKIRKIFDTHVHFRTGTMLKNVIPYIARYCRYAVAMGNLKNGPIVNSGLAARYYCEIKDAAADKRCDNFEPVMTVMLTYAMTPEILEKCFLIGARVLKLIPAGTSTGANDGVALWDLFRYYPVLAKAVELGMIFSVHCELNMEPHTDKKIPLAEQEARGISYLQQVREEFPDLKIIFEHGSSQELCQYFLSLDGANTAMTITGHHPFIRYHQVCDELGDVKNPWLYCKPVAKSKDDVAAVRSLMLSGHPRIFYGSDFAPHPPQDKIHNHAAGIANIPQVAIPSLWELFLKSSNDIDEAQNRFEDFTSGNALEFYGLPGYGDTITLQEEKWRVPREIKGGVRIFKNDEKLNWKIAN